ncbi:hypothetical protein HN018_17865 [Lichenicola cladoniae]|uniref:Uncharacterized protein n=1 Tax=Lichenicola cladoniae TaxID=1484109 RepID=A0A6M8HTZ4_9PROT|nr:hypothetical protein [Lichenicola cladoniae]NPD67718.1 hypothetical protein [Acetobacteraceae bacterium]QKE91647.1 hypothetical protein HN018_17865 [Lichenicola cladoniae]
MNRFVLAFASFAAMASAPAMASTPTAPTRPSPAQSSPAQSSPAQSSPAQSSAVQSSAVQSSPAMKTAAVTPDISCPGDTIVWVNARNHAYHVQGDPYFGHTKHGKFECRKAADAERGHQSARTR